MHKKPVKMTIYINIYLYIFIMFMLCIYAHGTKSRKVHGQSIGQRDFLRVWLCIYNMKEFDRNLYLVIFGAKFEIWKNPWNFRFFFFGHSSDFPRNVSGMSLECPRTVHGQIHGHYQESPNTAVILHISYLRLSK